MSPIISLSLALLAITISAASLNPADVDVLLKAHNSERALSKLSDLVWDAGLESTANQWATTCPNEHSSDALRKGASENLGWGWPTMNASNVANDWIIEKKDLVNGECNPGKQCGHYQEIVNPQIAALGCATALNCPSSQVSGQSVMQVWVCHYGKTANNATTPSPSGNATNAPTGNSSIPNTNGANTNGTNANGVKPNGTNANGAKPNSANPNGSNPNGVPARTSPSLNGNALPQRLSAFGSSGNGLPARSQASLFNSNGLPTGSSSPLSGMQATGGTKPPSLSIAEVAAAVAYSRLIRRPIPILNRNDGDQCDE